jgi:hypothetical protein
MMFRLALALPLAAAATAGAAGCQTGTTRTGGSPLRADLEKICNARALSGADLEEGGQGTYVMAQWLNTNVTSTEGHDFLIAFAKLGQDRDARRQMLEQAVARTGLATCPLIDDWR